MKSSLVVLSSRVAEGATEELVSCWAHLVVDHEGLLEKRARIFAGVFGHGWGCVAGATDLKDRLQLRAVRVRMAACEHLDNETAERPDVCFASVRGLADYFRCHPEDGTLQ